MGLFRRSSNTNALVGIGLLLLLAVIAGRGTVQRILADFIEGVDESVPCAWLRSGENRSQQQSLIGRAAAADAIQMRVRPGPMPNTADQSLVISIIMTNRSLGSVAIYYNESQVRLGDDGVSSGLGLVFNAPNPQPAGAPGGGGIPEADIRLLGPGQTCIHRQVIPFSQVGSLGLGLGENRVKAYYRNTSRGAIAATGNAIFTDQGLWVGIAESSLEPIPFAGG